MNGRVLATIFLCAAACSAPRHAERVAQVPPLAIEPAAVLELDAGTRTDADRSAPAPLTEVRQPEAGSQSADSQTESRTAGPIYRSVVRVVETPPAEPQHDTASGQAAEGGETPAQPRSATRLPPHISFHAGVYHDPACGFVPVHTAIGTSIGAAIGSHHGNAHRGAMIGGTVGFFLDMGRAFH